MAYEMAFKILGKLEVTVDGQRLQIGGLRRPTILSMLLLEANRVVSADKLVDAVWDGAAPPTCRTQLAICIASLRKMFHNAGCDQDILLTRAPGYLLVTEGHPVDLVDFEEYVASGNRAAEQGDVQAAADHLGRAVALWRGPALTGLSGHLLETEAARLAELYIGTKESYLAAKLQLGHHASVVGELAAMVREHPLREQQRTMLMRALYQCGRRSEALATFHEGRRIYIEELGLEPGGEMNELHNAILHDDESIQVPAPPVTTSPIVPPPQPTSAEAPTLLTTSVRLHAFVGREREIAELNAALERRRDQHALPVAAVTGAPGVGKSAFVTQWAHSAAATAHYPDGQLFVRLRAPHGEAGAKHPDQVISEALVGLGVDKAAQPEDPAECGQLYQRLLRGRRVLIIADDALTFAQVEPLIPHSRECALLVTSTHPLRRLVGAYRAKLLHLGTLSDEESVKLLQGVSGRPEDQDSAWRHLAGLCDGLPLALECIASVLAVKPHLTPARLAAQLADDHRQLAELNGRDDDFSARLARSIADLPDRESRLLEQLSDQPQHTFSTAHAAEITRTDLATAEDLLERLADGSLLYPVNVPGRHDAHYRLPRLLRLHLQYRHERSNVTGTGITLLPNPYVEHVREPVAARNA